MEFDNTAHAIWEEMRSGTPFSPPKRDTGPYEENFYGTDNLEGINFKKLIEFIQQSKTDKTLVFDRKLYETGTTVETYTPSVIKIAPNNVHFEYKNEKGKTVQLPLSGKLNKRIDYISHRYNYRIHIDPSGKKLLASLYINYFGTEKYQKDASSTKYEYDFYLSDKYAAIILETENFDHFIQLVNAVSDDKSLYRQIREEILLKYNQLLKNEKETQNLIFLYEHLPEFALEDPQFRLDDQLLMDHLYQFKNHDDSNWFQFQDGSGALIQLFRLMSKGETDFLYRVCMNHPQLIRELYYNLDGTSTIDNAPVKNRKVFADMIYMLCVNHAFKKLKKTGHVYRIGGNYFPDSNVNSGADEHNDKIYLKQYVTKTETVYDYFHGEQHASTDSEDIPLTDGEYYHPLDLVKLIDMNTDDQTPVLVPAILVKCYADEKEWEDIEQCIRIGTDILAIILGVITLGATSPLLLVLAVGDIGLTAADLVVALNEDELMQTKEGREFLAAWNKIILVGGIVTAGPLLVRSAFKTGAFLFSKATVAETKNFLRASLMKIILEIEIANFTKNTILIVDDVVEVVTVSKNHLKALDIKELQQAGVVFLEGQLSGAKSGASGIGLVYKGEILVSGEAKYVKGTISDILKLRGAKLITALDELFDMVYIEKEAIKHANAGEFALPGNPKKSTAPGAMKGGGHGQDNIDRLKELGRDYNVEHTYKNGVRIGNVKFHRNKMKQSGTGQSWFPPDWTEDMIEQAGKFVINNNLAAYRKAADGLPIFDNFNGVRIGVMKTNGKPSTIFPDAAKQPIPNSTKFENNPF